MYQHDDDPGPDGNDAPEIPTIGPNPDEERERVRAQLAYPRDSVKVDPDTGMRRYTKPPLPTLANLEILIGQDPALYPHLGLNEFVGKVTWKGRPVTDEDETGINLLIQGLYGLQSSTERVREVFHYVARERPWHPVRAWLSRLVWDGTPRLETLLSRYAGAADTKLNAIVGRKWAVSAVARIMEPGCKVDTTLILVGAQGARKSSFFAAMLPDPAWFSDTAMDLKGKDAYMQMQGVWLYEVAELSALRAQDAEVVKAFLTARVDRYRPPYGRNIREQPRQVLFVGTTNEPEFLNDPTGARRFWPVHVGVAGAIDLEAVEADRAQLWAEAMEYYQHGPDRTWWLTEEESAELVEVQGQYERTDPWRDVVAEWARDRTVPATVYDVMSVALKMEPRDCHKAAQMRVSGILAGLGWTKQRKQVSGVRAWLWAPPGVTL